MTDPKVSIAKQLRRIQRQRRERAAERIAGMTLRQQWDLACAIGAAKHDTARGAALRGRLEALYA